MGQILRPDEGSDNSVPQEGVRIPEPTFRAETQAKSLASKIFREHGVEEDLLPNRQIVIGQRRDFLWIIKGGRQARE